MSLPPLGRIPPEIAALSDYEALARERMGPQAWAYFSGGSADESTLADNLAAFARIRLQGRVLRPLAGGHTRLSLFGDDYPTPVFLAPVAYQTLAHPEGERATAVAAAAMRTGMVVSTLAGVDLDGIASAAPGRLWFQLYLQPERQATARLVARAEAAGCRALVLTVDAPVHGLRNREQRAGFALPPGIEAANLRGLPTPPTRPPAAAGQSPLFGSGLLDRAPTWDDVAWLRSITHLPLLLKGVTAPADAALAVAAGVSGLIVSNHGGRTLDTLPAALDALPAIAAAVARRVPVLLDGGIRRGSDVFKALALGADAVLVGRPYVYALAAAGAPGVAHVLHLLRAELEVTMALAGCRTLADIGPDALWRPGPEA